MFYSNTFWKRARADCNQNPLIRVAFAFAKAIFTLYIGLFPSTGDMFIGEICAACNVVDKDKGSGGDNNGTDDSNGSCYYRNNDMVRC